MTMEQRGFRNYTYGRMEQEKRQCPACKKMSKVMKHDNTTTPITEKLSCGHMIMLSKVREGNTPYAILPVVSIENILEALN